MVTDFVLSITSESPDTSIVVSCSAQVTKRGGGWDLNRDTRWGRQQQESCQALGAVTQWQVPTSLLPPLPFQLTQSDCPGPSSGILGSRQCSWPPPLIRQGTPPPHKDATRASLHLQFLLCFRSAGSNISSNHLGGRGGTHRTLEEAGRYSLGKAWPAQP